MQNAPAALRRLALPAYCKEVDINNSVPVFLLWLAESLAEDPAPLAALRELVENREECLRKTAEILGMSRDGAKEALLKVLHGGDLVGLPPCRFAQRLRNSVAYAISKLKPHFRKIWDFCVKRRKLGWDHVRRINYKNTDGAFVHFVTTRYEALVMSRAMAFFRDRGCETICLRHDSLVIEDRQNVVDEATLRELAEFCVAIDYGETETRPQGRRDLARLAKLARLSWKCSAMVARDGDREKLLEEEDKGSPAEQNGFENGGIYKTQEDIYQNEFMHPISFDKFRYQLVNAVTGLGKSHASRQAILQLLRANPEARVCIVTGRRTQASCVDGDLGSFLRENDIEATTLANYMDAPRDADGSLSQRQRIIIQYESLHRLVVQQGGTRMLIRYDILILDEFRLLSDQRVSMQTNRWNLRENNAIYERLCKETPRVLVMDKDLGSDSTCYDFFVGADGITTQDQVQYHDYRYVPPHLRRSIKVVGKLGKWLEKLRTNLREGKKTLVPCLSNREARAIYDMFVATGDAPERPDAKGKKVQTREDGKDEEVDPIWAQGARVRILTAQTPPLESQAMLSNINNLFRPSMPDDYTSGCVILIYTSSLCVAADLQDQIECVMLHCANGTGIARGGPPARILWQMVMRARRVRDSTVYCYFGEDFRPLSVRASKGSVRPWQHDGVYRELAEHFNEKRQQIRQVTLRANPKDKDSVYLMMDVGLRWKDIVDAGGRKLYSVEVNSNLVECLLARKTEVEHNRNELVFHQFVRGYPLVMDEPPSDEQLQVALDELRQPTSDPVVEPKQAKARDKLAGFRERVDDELEFVLSQEIKWGCVSDARKRILEIEGTTGTKRKNRQVELEVLETLRFYPGYLHAVRQLAMDGEVIPASELVEQYKAMRRHRRALRLLQVALSPVADAVKADDKALFSGSGAERKQVVEYVKLSTVAHHVIRETASVLGCQLPELLSPTHQLTNKQINKTGNRLAKLFEDLEISQRDPDTVRRAQPPKKAVVCLQSLLAKFGFDLVKTNTKRLPKDADGKRQEIVSYKPPPREQVQRQQQQQQPQQPPPAKRQKVTNDADV
eukprot:g83392.t1